MTILGTGRADMNQTCLYSMGCGRLVESPAGANFCLTVTKKGVRIIGASGGIAYDEATFKIENNQRPGVGTLLFVGDSLLARPGLGVFI